MIPNNEKKHIKRLNNKKIVIVEKFYNKKNQNNPILTRTSNYEKNDSIIECSKIEKEFFFEGQSIYKEKDYNKDIKYSYIDNISSDKDIECPSCGYKAKSIEFAAGCPYCDTDFCIGVSKKEEVIRDVIVKDSFFVVMLTVFMIIFAAADYLPLEVFGWLLVFSEFAFMVHLIIDIIKIKPMKNIWKEFKNMNMNINEQRVYNDLNTQLKDRYYDENNMEENNLIDFDISEYIKATIEKDKKIGLIYKIRKYYLINNQIEKKEVYNKAILERNIKVKNNKNFAIKCKNCGSPVNFNDRECSYCGTKNESNQGWFVIEIINEIK